MRVCSSVRPALASIASSRSFSTSLSTLTMLCPSLDRSIFCAMSTEWRTSFECTALIWASLRGAACTGDSLAARASSRSSSSAPPVASTLGWATNMQQILRPPTRALAGPAGTRGVTASGCCKRKSRCSLGE